MLELIGLEGIALPVLDGGPIGGTHLLPDTVDVKLQRDAFGDLLLFRLLLLQEKGRDEIAGESRLQGAAGPKRDCDSTPAQFPKKVCFTITLQQETTVLQLRPTFKGTLSGFE